MPNIVESQHFNICRPITCIRYQMKTPARIHLQAFGGGTWFVAGGKGLRHFINEAAFNEPPRPDISLMHIRCLCHVGYRLRGKRANISRLFDE